MHVAIAEDLAARQLAGLFVRLDEVLKASPAAGGGIAALG
jgi:hypothetical protein